MIKFPENLVDNESVFLGDKQFVYNGGKLIPYVVTNGGTELTSPKLNVETLTEFRHPVSGKPIYKKVINFGSLPNATTKTVSHGITGIDFIMIDFSNSFILVPGVPDASFSGMVMWSGADSVGAYLSSGNIFVYAGNNRTNMVGYFTLKYTKTADTSSSPVRSLYTGSLNTGSLNELNLNQETHAGYKRNGKDVYQIEVDFGVLPNNTTKTVGIPNYNASYTYWLSSDSYAFRGDTNVRIPIPYSAILNGIDYSASPFINNNSISIITYSDRSAFGISKIILHYTK